MTILMFGWFAFIAFLCGSFPTAYVVGRMRGTDIRQHGSGNVGATNAFRVLGKGTGFFVFLVDFAKGYLPVFIFLRSGGDPNIAAWIGLAAILGHVFTPFLGFRGGKGVATGAGILMASHPLLMAGGMGVWVGCFLVTRIVSISSLASLAAVNVLSYMAPVGNRSRAAFFLILVLVSWTHRDNLARLRRGTEKKIG